MVTLDRDRGVVVGVVIVAAVFYCCGRCYCNCRSCCQCVVVGVVSVDDVAA